jgi:four helix bundle protein
MERFEDIIAWQKARALTKSVYLVTRDEGFARDFGLAGQTQRAAVSIMANIAEGFDSNGLPEFHQFLSVAKHRARNSARASTLQWMSATSSSHNSKNCARRPKRFRESSRAFVPA